MCAIIILLQSVFKMPIKVVERASFAKRNNLKENGHFQFLHSVEIAEISPQHLFAKII